MKKQLFGYSISEVNIIINSLKQENESLNSTIIALKKQNSDIVISKNSEIDRMETTLISRNDSILEITNRTVELETELTSSVEALSASLKKAAELEAELASRDEALKANLKKAAELETELASRDEALSASLKKAAELDTELASRDEALSASLKKAAELEAHIRLLQDMLAKLKSDKTTLYNQIQKYIQAASDNQSLLQKAFMQSEKAYQDIISEFDDVSENAVGDQTRPRLWAAK